jgi:hypothetical protein
MLRSEGVPDGSHVTHHEQRPDFAPKIFEVSDDLHGPEACNRLLVPPKAHWIVLVDIRQAVVWRVEDTVQVRVLEEAPRYQCRSASLETGAEVYDRVHRLHN